jgi:hypothetical protein
MLILVSCSSQDIAVFPNSQHSFTGEELFKGIMLQYGPASNIIKSYKEANQIFKDKNIFTNEKLKEYDLFCNFILSSIRNIDDNYFNNFKKVITSNDFYEIEKQIDISRIMIQEIGLRSEKYSNAFKLALEIKEDMIKNWSVYDEMNLESKEGKKKFTDYVLALNKNKTISKSNPNLRPGTDQCITVVVVVAAYYAVAAAGAVVAGVTIAIAHNSVVVHNFVWVKTKVNELKQPGNEEYDNLIAEIATTFKND